MIMELASELFVLKREEAEILDINNSQLLDIKYAKTEFINITFDLKTSIEIFMLNNFPYFCFLVKNHKIK
jgi:hypothetical protein